MFYCYILKSASNGRFYIGSCGNTEQRLQQHNSGYSKSTKSGIPWVLVYKEPFSTRAQAMNREKQIKALKSRLSIERYIKNQNSVRPDHAA